MEMPKDFANGINRQRELAIKLLYKQISRFTSTPDNEWPLTFMDSLSSPRDFKRACLVAYALDDQLDCKLDNLVSVTFRPYPFKYEGAWRIEVSFNRKGPYSGKEWYVSQEKLWDAWIESSKKCE